MKRCLIDQKFSMAYHKAQYLDRCCSLCSCYPLEILLGSMALVFTVMLMILSCIFLHTLTNQFTKLTECIADIKIWMSNFLLINSAKIEILIIEQKKPSSQTNLEYCLTHDGCSVKFLSLDRNLGVLFDTNLSFEIVKPHFSILKTYQN